MISALLCLRSIRLRATAGGIGALLLTIFSAPPAGAQSYPNQVIKIVVPFTAGGGVDVAARIVAPKLGERSANRSSSKITAARAAPRRNRRRAAAPDGYTLLVGTGSTQGTNSNVYTKLTYDPVRDFVPVVLLTKSPLVMEARPSLPVKNVTDLIALANASPASSPSAPTASAASIIWSPSCSTPWRTSRPAMCRIAAPRRCFRT